MGNIYAERIKALRELMKENGWSAVLVGASDPHCSEYPAARWKQAEWLTGFTGEAASVVVTLNHAGLWTDTRYFIQAAEQLEGTGVELHKLRVPDAVPIPQWLAENVGYILGAPTIQSYYLGSGACPRKMNVVLDGLCWSAGDVLEIDSALSEATASEDFNYEIISRPDFLGQLWSDRPEIPATPVQTLDLEISGGESRLEKIGWLRKWMLRNSADNLLLSSLDEIAWLLNVRADDIEYNPYVISYLLVSQESVRWFVKKESYGDSDTEDSFDELSSDGISVEDYAAVEAALGEISAEESLLADPSSLNFHLFNLISSVYPPVQEGAAGFRLEKSPVILRKAVKTESETERLRETFVEDGLAVERFLKWLEENVAAAERGEAGTVCEWDASVKLSSLRAEIPGYRGDSFENISAYGPSAALPHYVTPVSGSRPICARGLYLVDSGGQYLTGTTDITRTVPMGVCTELEKEDYTLVLKGMIALSMAVFPKGTAGCQIDALAREPLWKARRNFGHGTGHGLGYYLGVHEGPQSIRQDFNPQPLLPGMVTSNEPGLYRAGMHGIRHENILLTVPDRIPGVNPTGCNEFGEWLRFETLTCCHIDTSAVIPVLLTREEIDWLNGYNASVYERLAPRMTSEEALWLASKTAKLL